MVYCAGMRTIKTFAEAEQAINDFVTPSNIGENYTLDRIKELLGHLDNPQDKFKTVHVAGTSGKTSTCYFIAKMLESGGYKTGLTISPHITEINERVQIGLKPLPEKNFCNELEKFLTILNKLSIRPTYFELMVAFAYWYFAKIEVDYAVVETGLGGLLDGTNTILRPDKICVITDIGLDHTSILGNTLKLIAQQKAGIIQEHNHVFMYDQGAEVTEQILAIAKEEHAVLHLIQGSGKISTDLPPYQERNWNLAKQVCEFILKTNGKDLNEEEWLGTAKVIIPGRTETITYGDKTIILDGAHNAQKMKTFIDSFKQKFPGESPAALLAISDDKDLDAIARELEGVASFIIVTSFKSNQDLQKISIDPKKLAKYFTVSKTVVEADAGKALALLLKRPEKTLLITGSLYLISEARKALAKIPKDT